MSQNRPREKYGVVEENVSYLFVLFLMDYVDKFRPTGQLINTSIYLIINM